MKRGEGKVSYQLEMSAINALPLMLMQSLKAKNGYSCWRVT